MIIPNKYIVGRNFPVKSKKNQCYSFDFNISKYDKDNNFFSDNRYKKEELYIVEINKKVWLGCLTTEYFFVYKKGYAPIKRCVFADYVPIYTHLDSGRTWLEEYIHNYLPYCPVDIVRECDILK